MPHISASLASSIFDFSWKASPLNQDKDSMNAEMNIFHLLAPPKTQSKDYAYYKSTSLLNEAEENIGQSGKERKKIGTKNFVGGSQSTLADVITALSNTVVLLTYLMRCSGDYTATTNPVLILLLCNMADKLNEHTTTNWANTFLPKHPWIPHALLSKVHLVVSGFSAIAHNSINQRKVASKRSVKAAMLDGPIRAYNAFMSALEEAVAGDIVGCFGSSPSTYESALSLPSADIKKRLGKLGEDLVPKPANKNNTYGWLVATDKTKSIPWPKGIHNICERWAIKGEECSNPNTCTLKHGRYRDFYKQDQVLIDKMVSDCPYLEFNTEAFPSGRRRGRKT